MRLLLDEHFSEQDAAEVRRHDPTIDIVSLHAWESGAYLAHDDAAILAEAYRQGRTLVTRDVRTIPPLRTSSSGIRVPLITGLPTRISGSWIMRSGSLLCSLAMEFTRSRGEPDFQLLVTTRMESTPSSVSCN